MAQQPVVSSLPANAAPVSSLPFMAFAEPEMRLFHPEDPDLDSPLLAQGPLTFAQAVRANPKKTLIPRPDDCRVLWDSYGMLPNIREHSSKVAVLALSLAQMANARGIRANEDAAYAAGLLHDLGKTYTIKYKGNHAQIGAAWTIRETRNPTIARAVLMHVHFPWEAKLGECLANPAFFVTMAVIYADKRVMHDTYVSVEERFEDLRKRYGVSEQALKYIERSLLQGLYIEKILSQQLGVELDAYTPHYGRLVR